MKKIILNFFASLTLLTGAASLNANFTENVPEKFTVTERWFSWSTTFDIAIKGRSIGMVHRKVFSLMPEYYLYDAEQNLISKARMRLLSLMTTFDVVNAHEQILGKVREKFVAFFPTFSIYSAQNQKMAEAKLNFWGTKYTIYDAFDGHKIAVMERSFFRLKNNWKTKILDTHAFTQKTIHPHMLITIAAFQADREYWEAQVKASNNLLQQLSGCASITAKDICDDQLLVFRQEIYQYGLAFENVEPTEENFKAIESMEEFESFSKMDQEFMTFIHALFQSSQLTNEEKAALLVMLKHIL